ncbi:MAG: efflux RND transporter permease subunit [Winogradskyella sp.]
MAKLKTSIETLIKFRVTILLLIAVLMGLAGYQTVNKLKIDNSLTIWFLEDDPSYQGYIDYQEKFGSDEIYVAMFPVDNVFSEEENKNLKALTADIESLPYVKTSFSLAKAKYPLYANNSIRFSDLYNPKRSEKGLKSLFAKLPNLTSQLISEDYNNLFFYVQLNPTPTIETKRKAILGEITATIEQHFTSYHLTGPPVLNEAYSKGIYKESLLFGVLTVLVITVLLLFLLPNKRYLLISLLSVAVPVSLLFGIISSMGFALNMISMLIPTILMVYSVSDAVHIINIYHKEGIKNKNLSRIDLLSITVRRSFTPCFYTTLTTFVGYFALFLSPLPAFKNMGILTCLGLLLSFILVYVITIIGFSFMSLNFEKVKPVLALKTFNQTKFISWLNTFTWRYKRGIIVGFSIVLLVGLYAVTKVKIDTRSLDLLAEGKAKEDLRIVEKQLKGSSRLQLNVSTKDGSTILSRDAMLQLENFQNKLEENPLIIAPVSVIDIKSFLEKRSPILFQSNISEEQIKTTLSKVDNTDNSFFKLFSKDFSTAGITLSLPEMTTSELEKILEDIERDFEASFKAEDYDLKINGFAVVFAQLNKFILETQFKSFFAAFFVAFLCLLIFIRSIRTTLLVLIPNVLPLAILAIAMSLLDIPLDVSTAMITPIMLGIAMDDTIHLVYKYRRSKLVSETPKERMDNAMHYTGNALISTTIALVGGFLIIASSATPSVSDFGILCAVTVAIALITDIFYLPALLKQLDR